MEHAFLLKSVKVMDPEGPWNEQVVDVLIQNGVIQDIATTLDDEHARRLEGEGTVLSPGWVDGQVHFREPGEETKEGIQSGLHAAARGGFTAVAILPSTHPCVDHAGAVRNVLATASSAHAEGVPTQALPLACITEQAQGQQIAEMHDLSTAGAVGFSDDAPLDKVSVLQRALTYGTSHGKVIMDMPLDQDLNPGGLMHEGVVSTEMGLTGIPSEAETIRVRRNLDVLKYAGGRLHLTDLSCAESIALVKAAKQDGLDVSCSTTAMHLCYTDEDLRGFQGVLKMRTPFRSAADRDALCAGVLDGTIDMVVSDHRPEDLENHDVEFMLSPHGMASLSSAFALALHGLVATSSDVESALGALLRAWTIGPRHVLSQAQATIDRGASCDLTWFHPTQPHRPHHASKGVNLPPLPNDLVGEVKGVFLEERHWLAD